MAFVQRYVAINCLRSLVAKLNAQNKSFDLMCENKPFTQDLLETDPGGTPVTEIMVRQSHFSKPDNLRRMWMANVKFNAGDTILVLNQTPTQAQPIDYPGVYTTLGVEWIIQVR